MIGFALMARKGKKDAPAHQALKLIAHPLRVRILASIADLGSASPRQLADVLEEPLGNVSYHVRTLHAGGLIRPNGTRPVRGALEHFYCAAHPDAAIAAQSLVEEGHKLAELVRGR
jgi:DNA-binding transcriptional ArsR family regulator